MVSSTVPKPAAKWPPRVLTLWIRNSRSSRASSGSLSTLRRRRSAGLEMGASSGYFSSAVLIARVYTGARGLTATSRTPHGGAAGATPSAPRQRSARSFRVEAAVVLGAVFERFGLRIGATLEQNLHLLLRGLERGLAVTRERHAALEEFQRFIERQIAPFESLDQGLKLCQGLLEIRGFAIAGHVLLRLS